MSIDLSNKNNFISVFTCLIVIYYKYICVKVKKYFKNSQRLNHVFIGKIKGVADNNLNSILGTHSSLYTLISLLYFLLNKLILLWLFITLFIQVGKRYIKFFYIKKDGLIHEVSQYLYRV